MGDLELAGERITAIIKDIIRWHEGEHPFWILCGTCNHTCTICAIHGHANRGYWVVVDVGFESILEEDGHEVELLIGKAARHMRRTCAG